MRNRIPPSVSAAACFLAVLVNLPTPAGASPEGLFEYTIEPLGSDTQSWPVIDFTGPYFYFLLTNTSAFPDSFSLSVQNLSQPAWFPQVCLRQVCFPDSARLRFESHSADTVGVNLVPFFDGLGEADFRVSSIGDPSQVSFFHIRLYAGTAAVGAGETPLAAASLQLSPSFPNPAIHSARIGFVLPRADHVSLRLYDVMGRQVATLVDASLPAGPHTVEWNGTLAGGRSAAAGTYFYRLETPREALSRRLVLLK